ncbi:MAG: homoprotocatechuate degradation operon regulator HpaR [Pseudomonadota bacterium]
MSQPPLPQTDRSLPIALMRARERVMAPIRDMLAETGITEQQWRVLRVLSEAETLDATELADRASLHQPSLTRILKTLNTRGFIARTQDANDKRRQAVTLTPKGHRVIAENAAEAAQIADALRDTLGAERFDMLLDLLSALDAFRYNGGSSPR